MFTMLVVYFTTKTDELQMKFSPSGKFIMPLFHVPAPPETQSAYKNRQAKNGLPIQNISA
jgi:hypothetical protein